MKNNFFIFCSSYMLSTDPRSCYHLSLQRFQCLVSGMLCLQYVKTLCRENRGITGLARSPAGRVTKRKRPIHSPFPITVLFTHLEETNFAKHNSRIQWSYFNTVLSGTVFSTAVVSLNQSTAICDIDLTVLPDRYCTICTYMFYQFLYKRPCIGYRTLLPAAQRRSRTDRGEKGKTGGMLLLAHCRCFIGWGMCSDGEAD